MNERRAGPVATTLLVWSAVTKRLREAMCDTLLIRYVAQPTGYAAHLDGAAIA